MFKCVVCQKVITCAAPEEFKVKRGEKRDEMNAEIVDLTKPANKPFFPASVRKSMMDLMTLFSER